MLKKTIQKWNPDAVNAFYTFNYIYRDAGNYKAYGAILLYGEIDSDYLQEVTSLFESDEFFIPQQLNIPTLYFDLFNLSDGPTEDDHGFHEFLDLVPSTIRDRSKLYYWGTTKKFLSTLQKINKSWDFSYFEKLLRSN